MKFLALLTLTFFVNAANASSWVVIYAAPADVEHPENAESYDLDTSSIIFRSPYVQAWVRYSRTPEQAVPGATYLAYKSMMALTHYDCVNKEFAQSQHLYYSEINATGRQIFSTSFPKEAIAKNMQVAAPDTLGEVMLNAVCIRKILKK